MNEYSTAQESAPSPEVVRPSDKSCSKCGLTLPSVLFYRNRGTYDGLASWCRDCTREAARKWNASEKGAASLAKFRESGYYVCGKGAVSRMACLARKEGVSCTVTASELTRWWKDTPDVCHYCRGGCGDFVRVKNFVLGYRGSDYEIYKFRKIFRCSTHRKTTRMALCRADTSQGYDLPNFRKACWFCTSVKGWSLSEDAALLACPLVMSRLGERIRAALELGPEGIPVPKSPSHLL